MLICVSGSVELRRAKGQRSKVNFILMLNLRWKEGQLSNF